MRARGWGLPFCLGSCITGRTSFREWVLTRGSHTGWGVPMPGVPSLHILPFAHIVHKRPRQLSKIFQDKTGGVLTQQVTVRPGCPGTWSWQWWWWLRRGLRGTGLVRGRQWLLPVLWLPLRGGWPKDVVEAGQADVKAKAKLGKKLLVERVELLWDVIAQVGGEETGNIAVLPQEEIQLLPWPGDEAAVSLSCQCDLWGREGAE